MKHIPFTAVLFALISLSATAGAELRFHRYYSDGMVLQREKPVPVKGWAEAGAEITVSFADQKKKATTDKHGQWVVTLDPMEANAEPRKLTALSSLATRPVSLQNVVVGDVLLFARQSSIDVSLGQNQEGKKAAAGYSGNPLLRAIVIRTIPAKDPRDDLSDKATAGWTEVEKGSALSMSAASFYLGEDLVKRRDVPLGIVDLHMGPHFAAGWLSDEGLDEAMVRFPDQADLGWFREHLPPQAEEWASGETARKRDEYYEKNKNRLGRKPSLGLAPLEQPYYPAAGYNAVIHPLRGLPVKGILLQLGNDYPLITYAKLRAEGKITDRAELDRAWPQAYRIIKNANRMTPATLPLVPGDWRRAFGNDALPMGIILPPGSDFFDYAIHNREIRELLRRTRAQAEKLWLIMPGTEHVPLSGQPADDKLLAERCRHWVLGALFEGEGVPGSGPVLAGIETGLGEATVLFEEGTAQGLKATGEGLEQFEVAGPDKEFVPCSARIEGDTIKLKSDDVHYIQFVRYNWKNKPDQGLVNAAGLPAVPFTSVPEWEYMWWPPAPPTELPMEYQTPASQWPRRDVSIINGALQDGNSGDSEPNPALLGPTGIVSDPFGPNLYVHRTEPGSPAHGKVLPGDIIFGVNGEEFGDDKYRQFANAITFSESPEAGGKMVLGTRRGGKNIQVELQLEVLGVYSSTTPFYCPKSAKIVKRAEEWIARRYRPESGLAGEPTGAFNTDLLFLMASGNPKYQGLVRRAIYKTLSQPLKEPDPNQRAIPWHLGYGAILLGEYYHLTGDPNVLPHLENNVGWAAITQLKPAAEPGPWENAYTEEQVGGWRSRYSPGRPMATGGYGLMPHAGMSCVMGMLLAKEAGLEIDEVALERGLVHYHKQRAEYGDVIYWYHPLRRDGPKQIRPEAEANGKLWSMNGKLGTAAALFNMAGYPTATEICSRYCVYGFNNTRHGHGGMFFNNFWTPVGAHISGEAGFKHFMKGQTWWRELYRRHDGSFNQVGRGGVGVGYALHYVAPKKRLRMLGAPKSAFGANPPEYLKPALEAHRNRDYAQAERLVRKELNERAIPAEELPVVEHLLGAIRAVKKSVDHDLGLVEEMLKRKEHYYASLELQQLKGVVAADDPRLQAIVSALESPQAADMIASSQRDVQARHKELQQQKKQDPKPAKAEPKGEWVCLMTEVGADKRSPLGKVPEAEATRWRMKVLERPEHAPEGWNKAKFDSADWDETTLPISWRVSHTALFRGTFNIEDKKALAALRFRGHFFRQQNVEIHINGELVAKVNNIAGADVTHELTDAALAAARNGKNTLALVTRHAKRWGKVKGDYSGAAGFGFRLDALQTEDKG